MVSKCGRGDTILLMEEESFVSGFTWEGEEIISDKISLCVTLSDDGFLEIYEDSDTIKRITLTPDQVIKLQLGLQGHKA